MDVTPFVLTPAALRAALATTRRMGCERDDDSQAAAIFIDALNVLEALFDPAHQVGGAAPMQGQAANPAATAPAEPANPEAGTPAPRALAVDADPPITIPELPAGPGYAADSASPSPAAVAPAPITVPEPAPPPVLAAEGSDPPPPRGKPRGQGARTSNTWPAPRDALLERRYANEGVTPELVEALNALDGLPVTARAVKARAYALRLRLTPEAHSRIGRECAERARAALAAKQRREEPPTPAVEALPTDAPWPDPPAAAAAPDPVAPPSAPVPLPAPVQAGDDQADAFAYFDAGKAVRDVVRDFSVDLTTAIGWHAQWKRQRAAA